MLDEITEFQLQTSDCVAKGENVGKTRIFGLGLACQGQRP